MIFEQQSHPLERSESGQKALLRAPGGAGIFDEGENAGARSRGGHQGAEPPKTKRPDDFRHRASKNGSCLLSQLVGQYHQRWRV